MARNHICAAALRIVWQRSIFIEMLNEELRNNRQTLNDVVRCRMMCNLLQRNPRTFIEGVNNLTAVLEQIIDQRNFFQDYPVQFINRVKNIAGH